MSLQSPIIRREIRNDGQYVERSIDLTLLGLLIASALIMGLAIVGGIHVIEDIIAWI